MSNHPRSDRLMERQKEAAERQAVWDDLTPKQKIEALDRRLGKGKGAGSQRERILKTKP